MSDQVFEQASLSRLFQIGLFQIPDYQRGYAWEKKHRQALLEDVADIQPGTRHFTGTIVLRRDRQLTLGLEAMSVYDIVDGQQRLTTLVILLRCLYERLAALGHEDAGDVVNRFVRHPKGQHRLVLADENQAFFIHLLDGNRALITEAVNRAQRNLREAYQEFGRFVEGLDEPAAVDLLERVTQRLQFNVFEVANASQVGVIFEVLNDRGRPLSQLDKVKNLFLYTISRANASGVNVAAGRAAADKVNDTWKTIYRELESIPTRHHRADEEDHLLQLHWYVTQDPDVKTTDIYDALKQNFRAQPRNAEAAPALLDRIAKYCDTLKEYTVYYRWVHGPDGAGLDEPVRAALRSLLRMPTRGGTLPFVLSAIGALRDRQDILEQCLRVVESYIFRVLLLAGARWNTGYPALARLAHDLYHEPEDPRLPLVELIILTYGRYVNPEGYVKLLAAIPEEKADDWGHLHYVLYEYEEHLVRAQSGSRIACSWEQLRARRESIEHILPQTIDGIPYWQERFVGGSHETLVHRLGNLVLTDFNSALSNRAFDVKCGQPGESTRTYANSAWAQERELLRSGEWKPEAIQEREERLLEFIHERWPHWAPAALSAFVKPKMPPAD